MPRIFLVKNRKDRRRASSFVRRHVRKLYGGIPPPSKIFLMAEHAGRICGTMALDFATEEEKFSLESIYSIDYKLSPWPFRRIFLAQFSKWWATREGVAVRLMYAAHEHALNQGKTHGLVEVKPKIVERVGEFGMSLVEVLGAKLRPEAGSKRREGYYKERPRPRLYMFDIARNAEAIKKYLDR